MRARNIKPAFFSNELLGTADPMLSLTFAGLWCLADRDGILENRPLRIKAELFPYRENLDINGYLTELERLGFIYIYEVEGKSYIEVVNFLVHQSPHGTEKSKNYPKYQGVKSITVKAPLNNVENSLRIQVSPQQERHDLLIDDSLIHRQTALPEPPKKTRSKKSVIPEDWQISESLRTWLSAKRPDLTDNRIEELRTAMIDYHRSRGNLFLDFDATFRSWVAKDLEYSKNRNSQHQTSLIDHGYVA